MRLMIEALCNADTSFLLFAQQHCAVNVASQDLADTVVVVVVVVVVHAKNPLAVSGVPFDLHLA